MDQEAYDAIRKELHAQPNEKAGLAYLLYEAEKIPEDKEGRIALGYLYNEALFEYQDLADDAVNPIFKALGDEVAFEKTFAQLNECLRKGDYASAEVLLSLIYPFAEMMSSFIEKDLEHRYAYFETMMDQFLFAYHNRGEAARLREIPYNIAQAFYAKGYLLSEEKRYKEALPYFSRALSYFPTKMAYRLEYFDAFAHFRDRDKAKALLIADFGYLHEANEAAVLYSALANIALAEKKNDEAYVLSMLGMTFAEKDEEKKTTEDLMMASLDLLKGQVQEMTPDALITFLKDHEIPLGADALFLQYLQDGIVHLADGLHEYEPAYSLCENFVSLTGHSPESVALLKSIGAKKDGSQA
jgi:tetratricopeptide (TPR) repeat protein